MVYGNKNKTPCINKKDRSSNKMTEMLLQESQFWVIILPVKRELSEHVHKELVHPANVLSAFI